VLPWTQGALALKQMMIYAELGDAMTHAAFCLVGAMVLFIIGVVSYSRKRLRSN
jgi:hypothetical protein